MKTYNVILIISLIIFLTSCNGGETPITKFNPYQGSDGVVMELLDNAPPDQIYEEDSFNVVVKLHNKGAYDISRDNGEWVYFRIVYDPFYFDMYENYNSQYATDLTAKDLFDHYGQFITKEFLLQSKKIEGQRENPTSKMLFNLCYPYQTLVTEDVCIDRDPFNLDVRDKPCTSRDITLTDQGAPIAVKKIEPRMPTKIDNDQVWVKPNFQITLKNVGGGNVIRRTNELLDKQCIVKDTDQQYWGSINVTAKLGNFDLDCSPEYATFYDGEALVNCQLPGDGFILLSPVSQPDVLVINTSYIYVTAESHDISILRQQTLP